MDPELLLIGIIFVVAGLIVSIVFYLDQKRTKALAQIALQMGFSFRPKDLNLLSEGFAHLHLFQQGHSKTPKNVLKGAANGMETVLFDYSYRVGSGKNSNTYHQTVCLFHLQDRSLPSFELRPENLLDKLVQVFGYQDIDFEASPEFSKNYLLRGSDPDVVRALFRPETIHFFKEQGGWSVEGGSGWLLIYRNNRRVQPEEMRGFLESSRRILSLFT
jgi:hypothetical protein